jgi:hypothetical protein
LEFQLGAEALPELRDGDMAIELGTVVVRSCIVKEWLDRSAPLGYNIRQSLHHSLQKCLLVFWQDLAAAVIAGLVQ